MTQTVLITGASSGIGKELAKLYAQDGCDLILVSRSEKGLKALKKELEESRSMHAFVFAMDLSRVGSAEALYHKISNSGRKVDVLINNAGFGDFGQAVDQSPRRVSDMIHLNITTLTQLSILFGNDMRRRRAGAIMNVASTAAFQPLPYFAAYSASKAYVLSFTEALFKELEDFNVAVTCLCPGGTRTEFFTTAGHPEINNEGLMDATAVARLGKKALETRTMTVIAGCKNAFRAFLPRILSRKRVASIAKKMMLEYK